MRKIYILAATAAIVMSSCTKNEISDIPNPNDNPNTIGLNIGAFAAKAPTTTVSLNAANQSVTIVSTASAFGTDGSLTFDYNSTNSDWEQTGAGTAAWGNIFASGAVSFYSMHTGAANHTGTLGEGTGVSFNEFTVNATVSSQQDLIYYAAQLSAIPSGGKIAAVFNHALSRVKMTQTAATSGNAFVAPADQITLKNVTSNGKPVLATTPSITWNAATTPATASYTYAPGQTDDMYLIPQTTTYDDTKAATEAGTYVESLFYTTVNSGDAFAGYSSVAEYQNVYPTATVTYTSAGSLDGTSHEAGDAYTGAMYVKGAFPLAQTFEAGKYYSLNLNYFGAGIVVAANGFFDAEGNELTVANGEEPDIDDPVNPDENTVIGLTVVVNAWPTVDDTAVPAEPEV